jgi:tyrosyl-tRNA synthetase
MSISDELMAKYYLLLLGTPQPVGHPMDAKKELARRLVERYHGADAGAEALADFNTRFSKKNLDEADLPNIAASLLSTDILSAAAAAYQTGYQITRSRSDLRRLVEQGSIQLRSEKITDPKAVLSVNAGDILRLDKTRAVRAIEG